MRNTAEEVVHSQSSEFERPSSKRFSTNCFLNNVSLVLEDIIRIATRKSPLAVWQAEFVAALIREAYPGIRTKLVRMTTRGDKILDSPLAKVGGKGLFVKELEQGMLNGHADIAVHSMKDVPVDYPPGLHLGAVLRRDDPRDALIACKGLRYAEIPKQARIGTSSLRRQCQVKAQFPECEIVSLRGNVNTRLNKLDAGEFDAILLAAAGLNRLGLDHRISELLDPSVCLPAIGQGAIGVECRCDDLRVNRILASLHHRDTSTCVMAERAMNRRLQGGCQVPIAGFAELNGNHLRLRGLVGHPDGSSIISGEVNGMASCAEELGYTMAEDLLSRGGDKILRMFFDL